MVNLIYYTDDASYFIMQQIMVYTALLCHFLNINFILWKKIANNLMIFQVVAYKINDCYAIRDLKYILCVLLRFPIDVGYYE
jgi:hypothetical protein